MSHQGVGGILDYAAEADIDNPASALADIDNPDVNQPSRVYPYEGEAQCDANKNIFLSAVRAVRDTAPDGFAAVKVTALGDPALLERVSLAVVALRNFFKDFNKDRLPQDHIEEYSKANIAFHQVRPLAVRSAVFGPAPGHRR